MRLYKVVYRLSEKGLPHVRYYKALSESTALSMFKETVRNGSLIGEAPLDIKVYNFSV
jgi:hypothetical protein